MIGETAQFGAILACAPDIAEIAKGDLALRVGWMTEQMRVTGCSRLGGGQRDAGQWNSNQ